MQFCNMETSTNWQGMSVNKAVKYYRADEAKWNQVKEWVGKVR